MRTRIRLHASAHEPRLGFADASPSRGNPLRPTWNLDPPPGGRVLKSPRKSTKAPESEKKCQNVWRFRLDPLPLRRSNPLNSILMDEKIIIKDPIAGLSTEIDKQEFALSLKTWRLRQALTQRQVAKMFGTSRYTILRAENAQPITWEMAYRLFVKLSKELVKERAAQDNG